MGVIQAQWVETNWCSYRGQANADGSIFIQRGRAPARLQRVCRDCVDGTPMASVFYNTRVGAGEVASGTAADAFPLVLRVRHYDSPADECGLTLQNTLTGKTNVIPAGTGAMVSAPVRGSPTDSRFASVLASPTETRSCNTIFRVATNAFNPGAPNRHESRVWTDYDVTAP